MDEDFTVWKRVILIVIGVLIIAAIAGGVYAWYKSHSFSSDTPDVSTNGNLPTSLEQQRELTKLYTAPAPTSTTSGALSTPAQKAAAKSSFSAPTESSKIQINQATIDSYTAPAGHK